MKIGRSIKIIFEATELTRGQLAAKMRISRAYLSGLETGRCDGGDIMLKRISRVFSIPAIYVLAASDQNFRKQFPGTYRNIKSRMKTLAAQSVMKLESKPAA